MALLEKQTIGASLRFRREELCVSLEEASGTLAVSKRNLRALEEDRMDMIPEEFYRELFLKSYTTYLGLDWDTIHTQYLRESLMSCDEHDAGKLLPQKRSFEHHRLSASAPHRMISRAAFMVALAGAIGYFVFFAMGSIQPPELILANPGKDMTVGAPTVEVIGKTSPQATVVLNGRTILKDADGTFRETITLREGLNDVVVSAQGKYSLSRTVTRKVFFRRDTASAQRSARTQF